MNDNAKMERVVMDISRGILDGYEAVKDKAGKNDAPVLDKNVPSM